MKSSSPPTRVQPSLTPCEKCPFQKVTTLRHFSSEELAFVKSFKRGESIFEAGSPIYLENTESANIYTILSGWAFRYKLLEDGRRQIINFALPTDLLGLQNSVFESMQHSVEALTRVTLCTFNRKDLWSMYKGHPDLAFDVTWIAAREEVILHDTIVSVGRRTALERVAYVLLNLYGRAKQLKLSKDDKVFIPLTQTHLSDALGLSVVHTNKTLQKLTKLGVMRWRQGTFHMLDQEKLSQIAMFHFNDKHPRPFI